MKTNIKLFVIYLAIAVAILHLITYYVTGYTPNDEEGRAGMVFMVVISITIIFINLMVTDKKNKEEILDTILCAKDKLIEEDCKKED